MSDIKFPIRVKDLNEMVSIFGDPLISKDHFGNIHVSNKWESQNLVLINTPLSLPKRVYCHKLLAPVLSDIFEDISSQGLEYKIHTWDGCFNPRYIRGTKIPSSHTFAVSVDLNALLNPMGLSWHNNPNKNKMDIQLVDIFVKHGMLWGENFKRSDPMHFSLVWW